MSQSDHWKPWLVVHLRSGAQRRRFAASAIEAILSTGWEPWECTVQQILPGTSVD